MDAVAFDVVRRGVEEDVAFVVRRGVEEDDDETESEGPCGEEDVAFVVLRGVEEDVAFVVRRDVDADVVVVLRVVEVDDDETESEGPCGEEDVVVVRRGVEEDVAFEVLRDVVEEDGDETESVMLLPGFSSLLLRFGASFSGFFSGSGLPQIGQIFF